MLCMTKCNVVAMYIYHTDFTVDLIWWGSLRLVPVTPLSV